MRIPRSRFGHLPTLLVVLGLAPSVRAEETQAGTTAEKLFREGRDAMKSGSFELACARFEESQRAAPALGTLLNLALCEEARGRLSRAHTLLEDVLQQASAEDPRRSLVEAHLPELVRRIPTLTLLPYGCEKNDCELLLDGVLVRPEYVRTPIPVDPGEHQVVLVVARHRNRSTAVWLAEGEAAVRTIEPDEPSEPKLEKNPPSKGGTAAPRADSAKPDRTLAYVFGAAGAASLVASLVTGLMAASDWDTVQHDCTGTTCSSDAGLAANSRGRALAIASTTTFAVGAVCLGTGAVLFFSGGTASPARGQHAAPSIAIGLSQRF